MNFNKIEPYTPTVASMWPARVQHWSGYGEYLKPSEQRRTEESAADYEPIRRDWLVGSEAFRRELLGAAAERVGPNHYGAQRHETSVQKAGRIMQEELRRLGWPEEELRRRGPKDTWT